MKTWPLFLLIFLSVEVFAQTKISGIVRYSGDRTAVDMANVVVQDPSDNSMLGYCTTGKDGLFEVQIASEAKSLQLLVTGFNINRKVISIKNVSQEISVDVEYRELNLTGSTIKTNSIKQTGDTVKYYVSQYADSLDLSIADVLKKMPGISVDKSGRIKYQGQAIDQFYIDGMDMMGSRYGIATNSLQAKDIGTVEVYENHQPIKILRDLLGQSEITGKVALNLKLKQNSKGAFISTIDLGGGYKPELWEVSGTGMMFKPSYQLLMTAKTNDTGSDIISELAEQWEEDTHRLSPFIDVYSPETPALDLERYMDNVSHAFSLSNLFKFGEDRIMSVNGIYYYDRQSFSDSSKTVYYLPSSDPLAIVEATDVIHKNHTGSLRGKYTANTAKLYLEETVDVVSQWDDASGSILTPDGKILQDYHASPNISVSNRLSVSKPVKDGNVLHFKSSLSLNDLPATLKISPALFPSIFGYGDSGTQGANALQRMSNRGFFTDNSLDMLFSLSRGLNLIIDAGFSSDNQAMNSELLGFRVDSDAFRNDLEYSRLDMKLKASLDFRRNKLVLNAIMGFDYADVHIEDNAGERTSSDSYPFLNPVLIAQYKVSEHLKFESTSSLTGNLGPVSDAYSGMIMTDYRSLSSYSGDIAKNFSKNSSLRFNYSNALSALFGSVGLTYWDRQSNLMYGTNFSENSSLVETFQIDNLSQGLSGDGRISKSLDAIHSTMELNAGYSKYWLDVLRQGTVIHTATTSPTLGFKFITNLANRLKSEYLMEFTNMRTSFKDDMAPTSSIDALHQKLSIDYSIKQIRLNVTGEHYFNSAIESGSRHVPFMDASISYKTRNVEYILEGRNLLNTETYNNRQISGAMEYKSCYQLRQRAILLKARFHIN